jgi:hypothetical protein
MLNRELFHMYQAWQQGDDHYVKNWYHFVEYAAKWNKTSIEVMRDILLKCSWFKTE